VPPGAPTGVTATAGNAQATVSFTAPASSGGAAITSYTATSSPGGLTATGAASPLTVTGLTNGTSYTFTVTASNGSTGPASAASGAVVPSLPDVAASVPVMTGYTTPAGVVAESTTLGGYPGWFVFDDAALSSVWLSADGSIANQWISYNFGFPVSVRELSFTGPPQAAAASRNPNSFRLEYFSGGIWNTAYTGTGTTSQSAQTFAIADVGKFAEWRLFIVSNHGDANYIALRNVEFDGFKSA